MVYTVGKTTNVGCCRFDLIDSPHQRQGGFVWLAHEKILHAGAAAVVSAAVKDAAAK